MDRAKGRRAQAATISSAARGSAATRSWPSLRASISWASSSPSTSRVMSVAPSAATSPAIWLRLVTTTRQSGEPGSSGRTWAALVALSSTISTRLPSTRLRNRAARSSSGAAIRCGGTPNASRNHRSATPGSMGWCGSGPRRSTYSWPSGKRLATWRPNRTASAVLPTPAVPEMTATGTDSSVPAARAEGSRACSTRSSSWRPEKPGASGGSWAGTGTPGGRAAAHDGDPLDPAAGGGPAGPVVPLGRTDPSDPRGVVPAAGPAWPPPAAVLAWPPPAAVSAWPPPAAGRRGADPGLAWSRAVSSGPGGRSSDGAPAARFSAGSQVSTCWWMRNRSAPGSMPSSSASTRLPSWNTRSASACRPLRYSAIISSPRMRSRSGWSVTRAVRSGTTSSWRPSASRTSARSSAAPERSSPSRTRSVSANGPGTPANAVPRQSPSALSSASTALVGSPFLRSCRARASCCSKATASGWPGTRCRT